MKPKNKLQAQVLALSKKLPSISETQVKWAYQNCMLHIGQRTKKGVVSCLECGHSWTDTTTEKHCTCPHCGTKLQVSDTRQRVFKEYEYFCIVTACGGFQVLRFFYIQSYAKVGKKAQYFHSEVIQRWIAPNGKFATMARLRPMTCFADTWIFQSAMEIRPEKTLYNAIPICIYPRQRLIPELKRSGYKRPIDKITPFDLFRTLLLHSRAETLLKAGQTKLLTFFAGRGFDKINNYWSSVKICLRNGYTIEDVSMWCDYIDLLRFFGKDLHNAKYVCPADLKAEHDLYVKKKREWQERERRAENQKKALENEAIFKEMKSRFFGIQFTDGVIEVRTLDSVEEIMHEGDAMHHCVFASEYHLKPDSLILSACVNGQRIETVEFSLSQMQVLQSRGVCNKNTEYHDQIINLVEKNIRLFQKQKRKKRLQKIAA
jgi:DNA-directed RNA polymerase subunit RPC12/RpoP